jgi:hypothetical protein
LRSRRCATFLDDGLGNSDGEAVFGDDLGDLERGIGSFVLGCAAIGRG